MTVSQGSILVVDDSREFLKLLTGVLSSDGYSVRAADGGELALACVATWKPDLILLDIRMPGIDGFEVCRRLKEHEASRGIPVVLISGATEVADRVQGLRLGAVDCVTKPFRNEELLARVRIHVELSRLRASLEQRVAERTAALGLANEQLHVELVRRTQAEQALLRERDLVSRIMETSPVGIVACDSAGEIVFANEAAEEILGRSAAMGLRYAPGALHLVGCDGGPLPVEDLPLERVRAARQAVHGLRHAVVHPDGHRALLDVNAAPLLSNGGEFDGMVAAIEDVTSREQAQAERERLLEQAQVANREKDRFLAVLSHELRTPLAAILAGVEVLQRTADEGDARSRRAVDVIRRNTNLQAKLVDDLLSLSRIVHGKVSLHRAPVELDALVSSVVEALRADAERAQVTLQAQVVPGLWTSGDIDRLQQIVINLVSNAIKYTLAGGTVVVSLTANGGRGRITVEDTGIGIEACRLGSLFQVFNQGEVGGQRSSGMGIGLALVKSLTEMHGGQVRGESEGPGRGSRFTVELPLMPAPAGVAPSHGSQARGEGAIRALVVEDNPDTCAMLQEALTLLAYHVVAAASGEEALDILGRERFDIILADIGLPGIDGYEFLRQARRLPSAAGVPAFAVTGYGEESDVRRAREAGFLGHFVKPVELMVLDRHIRQVVGMREGVGETAGVRPTCSCPTPSIRDPA